MNTMIKNVFNKNETIVRDYDYFQAVTPAESVSVDNGVICVLNKGSVYSPVAGKIKSIEKLEGGYSVTITHSPTFKSVISGLEYCYFETGFEVFSTTPIGYTQENVAKVEMYDQDVLLTNYSVENGLIKWN